MVSIGLTANITPEGMPNMPPTPPTVCRLQKGVRCTQATKSRARFVLSGALNLPECLGPLEPIGLADLQGAELMNRRDTKFPVMNSWIPGVVAACAPTYRVLEVSGVRAAGYRNIFFDTPDRRCWSDHVRGRGSRFKVRIRNYGEGGSTFLEIKRKTASGRTVKERWLRDAAAAWDAALTSEELALLANRLPEASGWAPSLRCDFTRATLVSTARGERITVDVDLRFADARRADGGAAAGGLAILEIKQTRVDRNSPAHLALDAHLGAPVPLGRPTSLSKYILGLGLRAPGLHPRTYRPVLRQLQALIDP